MMAFIDQEASEKAEEIDAKVGNIRDKQTKTGTKNVKSTLRNDIVISKSVTIAYRPTSILPHQIICTHSHERPQEANAKAKVSTYIEYTREMRELN